MDDFKKDNLFFIDIETDFRRKLLSVGIANYNKTLEREFFIFQNESDLHYPENVDPVYLSVLEKWRNAPKTKIVEMLSFVKGLTDENVIFIGWNIKGFDIPILKKYFSKYLNLDWKPIFFDLYFELRGFYKKSEKIKNKPENLKADSVWKWLSGTDLSENHTALSDAKLERHIFTLLKAKYGKKLIPLFS